MKYNLIIFLFLIALAGCVNNPNPYSKDLTLLGKYSLDCPEPSGLSFDINNNLIMVSDNNGKIYVTDQKGITLEQYFIFGGDFEGVTFINDTSYVVIEERNRELIFLNKSFDTTKTINTGINGIANDGFEGITFISSENYFLVANEKNPVAIYQISPDGNVILEHIISFAKDISGLFYDSETDLIWILSEQSKSMFKCDRSFNVIKTYEIPDDKIEGIVINEKNLFLVSDKSNLLYHFKIKD